MSFFLFFFGRKGEDKTSIQVGLVSPKFSGNAQQPKCLHVVVQITLSRCI